MMTRMERRLTRKNRAKTQIRQWFNKPVAIVYIHLLYLAVILWLDGLDYRTKVSLFAFLSALTLWTATPLPAGFTAVLLIVFIIFLNAGEVELLYHSLSGEVIWLMISSFIIGKAVKSSGLAERLTQYVLRRFQNKSSILAGLSSILFVSAFFIPSTSGRAALAMPVIKQFGKMFPVKAQKLLAVFAPVVILMSTSAALTAAGSHVIGIGLLESTTGRTISYMQWFLWGAPFAAAVTLITVILILRMMPPENRTGNMGNQQPETVSTGKTGWNEKEKRTVMIILFLIAGWMTESIHGYDIAFITVIGALAIMMPGCGIISWKQGINAVSWNLIVFVAAATTLGNVLADTGIVEWMESKMMDGLYLFASAPEWLIVLFILFVTVTSHLYITSHTTRAVVFIPGLLLLSEATGLNPSAVVFLSLIGMNYCITFPVSSKALLLFYEEGEISYHAGDLLKISAVFMPVYILAAMSFYFTYWQWTGMQL